MGAQRVKLSTEMQFLQDRLKDGTATLQKFSMKPLAKLDKAMQPRAIHLNMDHVKNLGDILQIQLKLGRDLDPGVLFRDPATDWVGLVDGWHRLKAYMLAKLDYFPAYVIEGTKDEAIEYAAMANQHAMLRRTPEDVKKQVWMLVGIDRWFNSSDSSIADHCGVSRGTAKKYRIEYCAANNKKLPDIVETTLGRRTARTKRPEGLTLITSHERRAGRKVVTRYRTVANGKVVQLGWNDKEEAERKLSILRQEHVESESKKMNLIGPNIYTYFLTRDVVLDRFDVAGGAYPGLMGFKTSQAIFTWTDFEGQDALQAAIGRLIGLRQLAMTRDLCLPPEYHVTDIGGPRLIILCYPEDGPAASIDLYRQANFEFLTPEQFYASIKGDGSDDTQAEPAPPDPDEPDAGAGGEPR